MAGTFRHSPHGHGDAGRTLRLQEQDTACKALLQVCTHRGLLDVPPIEYPECMRPESWIGAPGPERARLIPGDTAARTATDMAQAQLIEPRGGGERIDGIGGREMVLSVHRQPQIGRARR